MSGILRNLTPKHAGGTLNAGSRYAGFTGAQIEAATATGVNGPGIGINDGLDAVKQYRFIPRLGAAWPGVFYENGAFRANASVVDTVDVYEDNLPIGSEVVTVQIGAAPPPPPPPVAATNSLAGLSKLQRLIASI